MSTFNVSIQRAAPAWVRGRVLAAWNVIHMGSLAAGSAFWGLVAGWLGLVTALDVAAVLLAASMALAVRWALDPPPVAPPAPAPAGRASITRTRAVWPTATLAAVTPRAAAAPPAPSSR